MVLLTPTPTLISALHEYNSLSPEEPIPSDPPPPYIHHRTISKISTVLIAHANSPKNAALYRLNHLLKECTVYIPPKPPKPEPVRLFSSVLTLPPPPFPPPLHPFFLSFPGARTHTSFYPTHTHKTVNYYVLTFQKSPRVMNTNPSWHAFGCRLKPTATGVC